MRSSRTSCWRCPTRSTSAALALLALLGALVGGTGLPTAGAARARPEAGRKSPAAPDETADEDAPPGSTAADAEKAQARFEAALKLLGPGRAQAQAAATALTQLARDLPGSEVAPEALCEAAQIYEDQLGDPGQARALYQALVDHYPASRLLRRAQHRLSLLEAGLRTGAVPLQRFQEVLRSTENGTPQRIARLRELLAAYPDFALLDQALYLLGDAQLRAGDLPAAQATFATLHQRAPMSEWSAQAHKAEGDAQLAARRFALARAQYQALAHFSGPLWPEAAREGLEAVTRGAQRQLLARLAAALLVLLVLVGLGLLWRRDRSLRALWPPPLEVAYYAPVAAFLIAVGLSVKGGSIVPPLLSLAAGGLGLCWLSAALLGPEPGPGRDREPLAGRGFRALVLRLAGGALWRIAATAALVYLVVYHHGLLDLLVETLVNGPDSE